jgi:hypothetical protein
MVESKPPIYIAIGGFFQYFQAPTGTESVLRFPFSRKILKPLSKRIDG